MMLKKFDFTKPETLMVPPGTEQSLRTLMTESVFRHILYHASELNVSDVSFQTNFPVMIKKNNRVYAITKKVMTKLDMKRLVGFLYRAEEGDESAYQRVMSGKDSESSYAFQISRQGEEDKFLRFRCLSMRDGETGASVVMRLNNDDVLSLADINLSREHPLYQNMFPEKGLILITGSVDSGKTTLIYACLRELILDENKHAFINTYENPVEGNLRNVAIKNKVSNTLISQCPITPNGINSYSLGLEKSLRRNADIIVLGEIRSQEDVMGCMDATLASGKLVMGTLHTDNIPRTVSRLVNSLRFNDESKSRMMIFDLISSIHMLVSQKLLTTVDLGRVAVFEYLVFTKEVRDRILAVPIERMSLEMEKIMKEGGDTMADKALKLLKDGVISKQVCERFVANYGY